MSMHSQNEGWQQRLGTSGLLIVVGAVAALAASFLPWLTVSGVSSSGGMNGLDMIGEAVLPIFSPVFTVGLGVVAVALTIGGDSWLARGFEAVCGLGIALVGLLFVVRPGAVFGGGFAGAMVNALASPGIGIYLTIAAGLAIAAGGLLGDYE